MDGKLRNHAVHYAAIHELLAPWSVLWGHSVFHRFDEMERLVPEAWFQYGATAELADQFALGQGAGDDRAPASLCEWVSEIRKLCRLPQVGAAQPIHAPFDKGLTPKKRHEVAAVLGLLKEVGVASASVLDIGGGVGHLARHLALEFECSVDSVDRDPALQEKGREILVKQPWRDALKHPIRFVQGEFPDVEVGNYIWAIGLHTCGNLAWSQLELAETGCSVLNVGCCYDKLKIPTDTRRSQLVRQSPLPLTAETLFLANRGGVERSADEFIFQQHVQRYRFSLQALLIREGCREPHHETVGTADAGTYAGTFPVYVRDRLQHLEGVPASLRTLSDSAYDDFFHSVGPLVEKQRFVAFLRNLLARPLEIALLLDRALFMEEGLSSQANVRLIQLFDPQISPRNIGLLVFWR